MRRCVCVHFVVTGYTSGDIRGQLSHCWSLLVINSKHNHHHHSPVFNCQIHSPQI